MNVYLCVFVACGGGGGSEQCTWSPWQQARRWERVVFVVFVYVCVLGE